METIKSLNRQIKVVKKHIKAATPGLDLTDLRNLERRLSGKKLVLMGKVTKEAYEEWVKTM